MKNIFDILAGVGLTVPEDKKADFEAAFNENYKTVNDYSKVKYKKRIHKDALIYFICRVCLSPVLTR